MGREIVEAQRKDGRIGFVDAHNLLILKCGVVDFQDSETGEVWPEFSDDLSPVKFVS